MRRQIILDAAAQCFAERGFDATTMRDIAALTGIRPGSIYYHFESKNELFLAVHEQAVSQITERVEEAIQPGADPWTRLEQACVGYLECLVAKDNYASVVITEFPRRRSGAMREYLVGHRHRFENIFRTLIDDLPLGKEVDRKYWRLCLLGTLAWSNVWYKEGSDDVDDIARKFIALLAERTAR